MATTTARISVARASHDNLFGTEEVPRATARGTSPHLTDDLLARA